jgi:hypothetical protein
VVQTPRPSSVQIGSDLLGLLGLSVGLRTKTKGAFTFEMKRFADRVTLHGSSNYSFDYNSQVQSSLFRIT